MKSKSTQTKKSLQGIADHRLQNLAGKTRINSLNLLNFFRQEKAIVLIIVFLFVSYTQVFGQSPYTTVANGNWNADATWSGTGVPVAGDVVNISGGFTVTVTANAACASITFPATATTNNLNINSGISLTVSGSITIPRSTTGVNTLAVGAGVLNTVSIAFTSGGLTNRHEITISTGTVTVSGDVTQTGSTGSATISFSGTGTLNLGGAFLTAATGTLTTVAGCTVNYNGVAQTVGNFIYTNLTLSGSGAKTTTGATVNGILSMEGTATTTGTVATYGGAATLQYKGTAAQTTGTEFPATFNGSGGVIINNSNGVSLGASRAISSSLTLTAGRLTTSAANLLTVTNNGTTAISDGSATSFINGPVSWSLASGSAYIFTVGKGTTYLPFSMLNSNSAATAQVEAFVANPGGTLDATLTSKSTTEYWSLVTSNSNTTVSIARPTPISPFDAIGGSPTLAGIYTSLSGTAGANGVTGSILIGTNRYFVLAQKAATSFTSAFPGGNWNTAATWNPASVPSPGSSVLISPDGPVTVTSTPVAIGDLSVEGLLDVSTYTVSGTGSIYVSGTGTLLVGGTNNFPAVFSPIFLNLTSNVNYNNDGNQTVTDASYGNLILSGSGIKTMPVSSFNVGGNFTIRGSATTTPSVAIDVSGNTTLSGTSVLTIGAANILSNTGLFILDGGTFRTGATTGNSETVGVLSVVNSSTIALGTGTHSLNFAASNGVTWSGTTLTITGWTGTVGSSGTGGRIFFGNTSSTLTAAQLAKISFAGYSGTQAILLNTGELVPGSSPNLAITGITNHGGSCIGLAANPITYTISNTGSTAVGITVNSNNSQFVVSGAPTTIGGGASATYTVTFTPTSSGAKTATITVASTTSGSNSPTSSLTGTGNDFPIAGLSSSDLDNIICAGNPVTFTATGGTTYEFFVDAVSKGVASATSTFITSGLLTGQTVTVKVTNAGGCFATSTGITTTVNDLPATPVISGNPTVIVGSSTLFGSIYGGGVWTSSDPTKATVDPSTGLVTGIAAGTTTITYTVTNVSGCSNYDNKLVTVLLSTGIEVITGDAGLLLKNYPNPFARNTTFRYTLPKEGRVTLTIRNLSGQAVKTYVNENEPQGEYSIEIETGDLQSGVYIATLSLKGKGIELVKTIRLVKGK